MSQSLFTKIINGEIPSHKIYEDDHVYAFLDIHPVAKGHVLLVPKQQIEFVWDLPEDIYLSLQLVVKKIALHLRVALAVPYVAERIIGVDVPHAHIQLIPFTDAAELLIQPDAHAEPDHEVLAAIAAEIAL